MRANIDRPRDAVIREAQEAAAVAYVTPAACCSACCLLVRAVGALESIPEAVYSQKQRERRGDNIAQPPKDSPTETSAPYVLWLSRCVTVAVSRSSYAANGSIYTRHSETDSVCDTWVEFLANAKMYYLPHRDAPRPPTGLILLLPLPQAVVVRVAAMCGPCCYSAHIVVALRFLLTPPAPPAPAARLM